MTNGSKIVNLNLRVLQHHDLRDSVFLHFTNLLNVFSLFTKMFGFRQIDFRLNY